MKAKGNTGQQSLILGKMPSYATPATHIAAGPWCFAGQENLFPDWEKNFLFPPEPLADPEMLFMASSAALTLCLESIPELAEYLTPDYKKFSKKYWEILLCPWALNVARQIVERSLRCEALVSSYGNLNLEVPIIAHDLEFNFLDENDYTMRGTLGIEYNHWLFSRLLSKNMPENWRVEITESPIHKNEVKEKTLKSKMRAVLRNLSLKFPFPKLKGMSLWETVQFSMAINKGSSKSNFLPDPEYKFIDHNALNRINLPEDCLDIFLKSMPLSLKTLVHKPVEKKAKKSRLHMASIVAYEDAAYRQSLAIWREKGNRLAYTQHGGNYGQVKVACDSVLVEYCQDAFFTWGWEKHGDYAGNFIPIPYPQLARIRNCRSNDKSDNIIFVGTEMAAYGYRLDSRPTPLQFIKYRAAKAEFMNALVPELVSKTFYRPYFKVPGTLADAEWLFSLFPELRLHRGALFPELADCALLVIDHPGTTMLEAISANIPIVLYWERSHWQLTPEADKYISMLEDLKIWHSTPESAASHVNTIWNRVDEWWKEHKIQKAINIYRRKYARLPEGNIVKEWTSILRNL